jgi:K+-transporting ATPase ATPase C chain
MWLEFRRALVMTLALTAISGLIYPLAVAGVANLLFPYQAGGSLLTDNGTVVGSTLIGQNFTGAGYFHPRPSAAGDNGYDPMSSGGSNLGPIDHRLIDRVRATAAQLREQDGQLPIPVDLVTASGSGLDPHITPAAAEFQVGRVARARGLPEDRVRRLAARCTEGRQYGVLGEPRVNVLRLNLALDATRAAETGSP